MAVLGALDESRAWGYAVHHYAMGIHADRAARARRAVESCFLPASVMSAAGVDWAHIADVLESGVRTGEESGGGLYP